MTFCMEDFFNILIARKSRMLIRIVLIIFICIEYEDGTKSRPPTTTKSNLLRYVSSRHREYYGFFFM